MEYAVADNNRARALNSNFAKSEYENEMDTVGSGDPVMGTKIARKAKAMLDNGLEWSRKGEHAKAIEEYQKAIRISPEYASAYFYKGLALYNMGALEKSLIDFKKALRLDPANKDYQRIMSNINAKLKHKK